MNYCIFRMEKLKTSADVCNVLKEQHRAPDYISDRADVTRSHLNTYSADFDSAFEKFKELLPKKRRKNAVVALNFLITTSQEFESSDQEILYYRKAVEFIGKNFGEVIGWGIHRDETGTHLQAVSIPLVNGKLNARELVGGSKQRMNEIQDSFYYEVGEPFGLQRGLKGSKTVHKTVEEHIRETREQLREEEETLQLQMKDVRAQKIYLEKRESEVKKREQAVSAAEKKNTELSQELAARESAISKKESELTEENNKLVADRRWLDSSAAAAANMLEKAKITSKTPVDEVIGFCHSLVNKVAELTQTIKKVLDVPLEKVEQFCRDARAAGKKTLREYLFPKREYKIKNVSKEPSTHSKGHKR